MRTIRYIFFPLLLFFGGLVHSQIIEYYSNPQRYFFHNYIPTNDTIVPYIVCFERYNPRTAIFTRTYTSDSRLTIYGVAIPIQCFNDIPQYQAPVGTERWNNMMHFFDTSNCAVYVATKGTLPDCDMDILARSGIKRGNHVIEGTFFQMPETDTIIITYQNHWLRHGVIEVYFPQPVTVSDTFFIGSNIPPIQVEDNGPLVFGIGGLLSRPATDPQLHCGYTKIMYGDYLAWTEDGNDLYHAGMPCENSWGGPFPIIAPPPCVEPLRLTVTEQHKQGATIAWDAQYANTLFELEYGPQGFAPGSGTTVGNIYPDAQHHCSQTISGLPMDSDITARVRAFCQIAGGFSDWQSVDFHSQLYYTVSTSVNNDYWGWVKGGGDYIADTTVRLYAYPKSSLCPFLNWSDGTNQNPRVVTVTRDTSFRAIFRCDSSDVTSIHDIDASPATFTLHPNPAHGELTIAYDLPIGDWSISDMQGRTLLSGHTTKPSTTIDIASLRHGIYIVSIKTQEGKKNQVFIKQ